MRENNLLVGSIEVETLRQVLLKSLPVGYFDNALEDGADWFIGVVRES